MFAFILLGLSLLSIVSGGSDFSYDGSHGPSHWGEQYETCVGKHQSPINIEDHDVQRVNLPPLQFFGLQNPRFSIMANNGHTVMFRTNESEVAMVSGGPLGNEMYVFEQLHFHWGENDREGSEDLINNHSFAMELHAVFYKKAYKSLAEAVKHADGLTVLAHFYEVGNETNPTYEPIVQSLPNVETVKTEVALQEPLLLSRLIEPDQMTIQNYYTYEGSLTTPPCLEVVTWIDFIEPQLLSHNQLEAFRNIRTDDGRKLTHNFRPIQPLTDRTVYHNIPNADNSVPKNISRTSQRQPNKNGSEGHSGQQPVGTLNWHITLVPFLGAILCLKQ